MLNPVAAWVLLGPFGSEKLFHPMSDGQKTQSGLKGLHRAFSPSHSSFRKQMQMSFLTDVKDRNSLEEPNSLLSHRRNHNMCNASPNNNSQKPLTLPELYQKLNPTDRDADFKDMCQMQKWEKEIELWSFQTWWRRMGHGSRIWTRHRSRNCSLLL